MNDLVTLHIFADDYTPLRSWQLAQWCKAHGADEWTVAAISVEGAPSGLFDRFNEAMTPFRLPNAPRSHVTAYQGEQFLRDAYLWKLNSASFASLQEFFSDGLFTYRSDEDGWFEDLILYRQGELMLGVVSHEGEGILRVTSEEKQSLERDGFPFRASGAYVGY